MICGLEHTTLGQGMGHLVLLDNNFLFKNFDRVQLGGSLLATQNNLTKGALAEHLEELKILQSLQGDKMESARSRPWSMTRWVVLTTFLTPLLLQVVPCTENCSESSSSAMVAMSTSVMSVCSDGVIATSPTSMSRLDTLRMASVHCWRSNSDSTANVLSITVVHCRPRMMKVNGLGRSTVMIWQPRTVKLLSRKSDGVLALSAGLLR